MSTAILRIAIKILCQEIAEEKMRSCEMFHQAAAMEAACIVGENK